MTTVNNLLKKIDSLLKNDKNSSALARKTGIQRQVIDKYKKGKSDIKNMTAENIIKFEKYFKEMDKMEKEILILVEAVIGTYDNNGNTDIMLEVDDQELIVKDVPYTDDDLDQTGQDFKTSFYLETIQKAIENKEIEIVE